MRRTPTAARRGGAPVARERGAGGTRCSSVRADLARAAAAGLRVRRTGCIWQADGPCRDRKREVHRDSGVRGGCFVAESVDVLSFWSDRREPHRLEVLLNEPQEE